MSRFSELDADIKVHEQNEFVYGKVVSFPEEIHIVIEIDLFMDTSRNLGAYSNFYDAHKACVKEQDSANEQGRYKYLVDTVQMLDY